MAKKFSMLLGVVFLAVGLLGWITGGHNHQLIVFGINMNHNLVHLLSGIVALLAAFAGGEKYSKLYCLVFGAVYGVVTIAGFLNVDQVVSLLNINMADNFLHLGIAAASLYVGATSKG